MLNYSVLQGRIANEIELRYTNSGTANLFLTIAAERNYTNKNGEKETDFIPVKFWGKTAEIVAQYHTKGNRIIAEGEIRQERWEKDGQNKSRIVLNASGFQFDKSKSNNTQQNNTSVQNKQKQAADEEFEKQFDDNFDADDFDVPF